MRSTLARILMNESRRVTNHESLVVDIACMHYALWIDCSTTVIVPSTVVSPCVPIAVIASNLETWGPSRHTRTAYCLGSRLTPRNQPTNHTHVPLQVGHQPMAIDTCNAQHTNASGFSAWHLLDVPLLLFRVRPWHPGQRLDSYRRWQYWPVSSRLQSATSVCQVAALMPSGTFTRVTISAVDTRGSSPARSFNAT